MMVAKELNGIIPIRQKSIAKNVKGKSFVESEENSIRDPKRET
jgi:hypothetical protein